jgi:HK97 gp10 family phage protein
MAKVTTDTIRLNAIIDNTGRNTKQMLKAIGFQIEAKSKMKAPIDTGALRNSIYMATEEDNSPPFESDETLPNPPKDSINVGPSVEYAIFQELGTSFSSPQPFMTPALREVERELEQSARILLNE